MWAVMKAYSFTSMSVMGMDLRSPPEGPQRFIPLFETREQAIEFAGDDKHIAEFALVDHKEMKTGTE